MKHGTTGPPLTRCSLRARRMLQENHSPCSSPVSDLLILGIGAHAAEMAGIVGRINRAAPVWRLLGFVSPHAAHSGGTLNDHPVLGTAAIEDLPAAALAVENEWPRPL